MDTGPGGVLVFLQTANRDRGRGVLERMLGEVLNHVSIYMNHALRFFQQQEPLQVLKTNCGPNVQRRLDGKYTLRRSETIGSPAKFRSPRDVDVRWLPHSAPVWIRREGDLLFVCTEAGSLKEKIRSAPPAFRFLSWNLSIPTQKVKFVGGLSSGARTPN